jgi:hypothetical protein
VSAVWALPRIPPGDGAAAGCAADGRAVDVDGDAGGRDVDARVPDPVGGERNGLSGAEKIVDPAVVAATAYR